MLNVRTEECSQGYGWGGILGDTVAGEMQGQSLPYPSQPFSTAPSASLGPLHLAEKV